MAFNRCIVTFDTVMRFFLRIQLLYLKLKSTQRAQISLLEIFIGGGAEIYGTPVVVATAARINFTGG